MLQESIIKHETIGYMFKKLNPQNTFGLFGFECEDGWLPLIFNTLILISMFDSKKELRIAQIKEKFGALRIYLNYPENVDSDIMDTIQSILSEAETESSKRCEICGAKDKIKSINGWLQCLCWWHRFKKHF